MAPESSGLLFGAKGDWVAQNKQHGLCFWITILWHRIYFTSLPKLLFCALGDALTILMMEMKETREVK